MTTGFLGISGYGGHCNSEETIIHIKSFSQWTRGSKNWRHKTYSFLYIQFGRPISHSDKYIYYSKSKLGNVLLSIIKGPFSWSVKFYLNYILKRVGGSKFFMGGDSK